MCTFTDCMVEIQKCISIIAIVAYCKVHNAHEIDYVAIDNMALSSKSSNQRGGKNIHRMMLKHSKIMIEG